MARRATSALLATSLLITGASLNAQEPAPVTPAPPTSKPAPAPALVGAAPNLSLELEVKPTAEYLYITLYLLNHADEALAFPHEVYGELRINLSQAQLQLGKRAHGLQYRAMGEGGMRRGTKGSYIRLPAMVNGEASKTKLHTYQVAWPRTLLDSKRRPTSRQGSLLLDLKLYFGARHHITTRTVQAVRPLSIPASISTGLLKEAP